jgi:hypothetical protein
MDETFDTVELFEAHTDGDGNCHVWYISGKDSNNNDKLEKLKFKSKNPTTAEFEAEAKKRNAQLKKEYDDKKAAEK